MLISVNMFLLQSSVLQNTIIEEENLLTEGEGQVGLPVLYCSSLLLCTSEGRSRKEKSDDR